MNSRLLALSARHITRFHRPFLTPTMSAHSSNNPSKAKTITRGLAVTREHYEAHSTDTYEDAYFYEPGAYTDYLRDLVKDRLGLNDVSSSSTTLLDVGGGTGNFTRMILEGTQAKAVVIDPFLVEETMSDDCEQLQFVRAPAEVFKTPTSETDQYWRGDYQQVLLKEVIHHIDESDRTDVFRGIRLGLTKLHDDNVPALLIITRPQVEIDYPLWPEAKRVWAENQPSADILHQELNAAGFSNVDVSIEAYPCSIPLDRWQGMIKKRFWSTFASFSDDELDAACKLIAETEANRVEQGRIHFEDRLVFLSARL